MSVTLNHRIHRWNHANPSPPTPRCEWQAFSFQWLNVFLPSHTFIPTQHNMCFTLFCALSGLAQVHKKHACKLLLILLLKAAGWDGVFFFFFWSACKMHNSSVTWVKTKVLWCCTIIPTGPLCLILVQLKTLSLLIDIANQIQSICDWLTGWQRVSGRRWKLWNSIKTAGQQVKILILLTHGH